MTYEGQTFLFAFFLINKEKVTFHASLTHANPFSSKNKAILCKIYLYT